MFATVLAMTEPLAQLVTWGELLDELFIHHRVQLAVSTLMGAILGLVGCFVVLRRMALLGDALSHAVLPGVAIAFLVISATVGALGAAGKIWGLFAGALIAGLLTTFGINLVTRHSRAKEDAAVGIVFTAMFAVGVILVSKFPQGTHFDLKCFLFGELLATQQADLIAAGIIATLVMLLVVVFYHPLKLVSFDAQMAAAAGVPVQFIHYLLMGLLSATIVTALQSVGVIMAIAMLITPAAIAYQLTNRLSVMLVLSALAGAVSALLGLMLAFMYSMPPGPAMVVVATALFLVTMAVAPEYGFIVRLIRRRRLYRHILEEDVLKSLQGLGGRGETAAIRARIGLHATAEEVEAALRRLAGAAWILHTGERAELTPSGRDRAEMLVRSHRLWETYLAEHNVPEDRVHEAAERLEHAHDVAEEIARELGHPQHDPHGEPIPAPREPAP